MKILAVIPAYNEQDSIISVISDIKMNYPQADVLIINDCSKDRTAYLAASMGAKVISLPCNLGIGGAVQTGFLFARDNEYDIAFQFDGDGQHLATEIPKLIHVILNNEADMVIGSRFLVENDYKPSFFRKLGINFFQLINTLILKQKVTDNTSGFRAYNQEAINYLANNYPQDYPEVEAIVIMAKANFVIKEIPVKMRERQGGKSSITSFKSMYYMIKVSFCIFINLLRNHPKRRSEEVWS
jgi:hypothetical protein